MRKLVVKTMTMIMASTLVLGLVTTTPGQESPGQFYKGNTITWISATAAGRGGDLMTRLVAQFLGEDIGATVKYENMGTNEGVNWAYTRGSKDGLTLVSKITNAVIMNDLLNAPGVQYEAEKYLYISDLDPAAFVLAVSAKSPYRTLDDLRRAKGLKAGGTSAKGALATAAAVTLDVLGLDGKVITGYKGSGSVMSAVMRRELDIIVIRGGSIAKDVKNGDLVPLFALTDEGSEVFPDIPSIRAFGAEVPKDLEDPLDLVASAGTMVAMPPGSPQNRVDYLRMAFERLNKNKDLKAQLKKLRGAEIVFVPGEKLQARIVRLMGNKALGSQINAILDKYTAIR